MMSRFLWALSACALIFGVPAAAQQASEHSSASAATNGAGSKTATPSARTATAPDSTRVNANLPLRYESSWGSANIVRGADGPVIGTVGWFRGFDVEKLVESSPRAVAEARNFHTNNFRGSLVSTLGAVTTVVGIVVSANSSNNAASPILIIGGAGAIGWGLQHINIGYAALSKALWWYNRDTAEPSRRPEPVTH